jgi:hypothetical protein
MVLLSLAAGTAAVMLWPHAQAQAPKQQPAPKQQSQPQAQAPKPAQIDRNGVLILIMGLRYSDGLFPISGRDVHDAPALPDKKGTIAPARRQGCGACGRYCGGSATNRDDRERGRDQNRSSDGQQGQWESGMANVIGLLTAILIAGSAMGEGLPRGNARDAFIASAVKVCFKTQRAATENVGLPLENIVVYCTC